MISRTVLAISIASIVICSPHATFGQKSEAEEKAERLAWTKYYVASLPSYRFVTERERKPLKVIAEAKLRWDNPVREGRTHGELFVWTNEGRGAVVGNILSYDFGGPDQRRVCHEFHSFDAEPIVCMRDKGSFKLRGPGVEYKPIPGAPQPAKTRALRLVQMRRLSKGFEASTRNGDVSLPLRPLNQPLYRFETKRIDDDGAIFAYVTGTDPEILVAIVARNTDNGPEWHFGAGRYTDLQIDLEYKNKTVWQFQDWSKYEGGYYVRHGIDFQPHMPKVAAQSPASD